MNGAFDPTLGHKHRGTAGDGPLIPAASISGSIANATNASNVTTNINGVAITSIFETGGLKVKNATNADTLATYSPNTVPIANKIILVATDNNTALDGSFWRGTTTPTGTMRMNYNGYFYATKVFNEVYADYAEYFFKDEVIEPGDVVSINPDGVGYVKSKHRNDPFVIGVCSDDFAFCIGGKEEGHAAIGLVGKVRVRTYGRIKKGDLLISSNIPGVAQKATFFDLLKMIFKPGTIIGKALEDKCDDQIARVKMLIWNR